MPPCQGIRDKQERPRLHKSRSCVISQDARDAPGHAWQYRQYAVPISFAKITSRCAMTEVKKRKRRQTSGGARTSKIDFPKVSEKKVEGLRCVSSSRRTLFTERGLPWSPRGHLEPEWLTEEQLEPQSGEDADTLPPRLYQLLQDKDGPGTCPSWSIIFFPALSLR